MSECTKQEEPKSPMDCCPVDVAIEKWSDAFCQAKYEVMVEILKGKIKERWSDCMDKASDEVLDSMEAQWGAMLQSAKGRVALKENLKNLMFEKLED